jgi:O-antigen ligase
LLFLIGLVILGGVTSQSLMDIATTALFLMLLTDLVRKKTSLKQIKFIGIEWAFVGFFTVAIIGLYLNGKAPVPWFNYLSRFNWILNLYIFIYAFDQIEFDGVKWLKYFCLAFLIPNIYALVTYVIYYDFLLKREITAILGLVDSATYHAHGNSLIFIFFTALFIFLNKHLSKLEKFLIATCLSLMGASIFFTFTRGIWGATFVTLFILLFIRSKKMTLVFLGFSVIFGTIALSTSDMVQNRLLTTFSSNSDHLRGELIQVHLLMLKDHPWVGIGYWDSYRQIADYWPRLGRAPTYYESHAHNQVVNLLGTTGVLGTLFFGAIAFFFLKMSWTFYKSSMKNDKIRPLAIACFILLIQFFLACLTDVTFEYAKIRGILIVGLAALVSFSKRQAKKE